MPTSVVSISVEKFHGGVARAGDAVQLQFDDPAGRTHALDMSLENAMHMLASLSMLPGADAALQRAGWITAHCPRVPTGSAN